MGLAPFMETNWTWSLLAPFLGAGQWHSSTTGIFIIPSRGIELTAHRNTLAKMFGTIDIIQWLSKVTFLQGQKQEVSIWRFPKMGVPSKWMVYKGVSIKMDDWRFPLFRKPPYVSWLLAQVDRLSVILQASESPGPSVQICSLAW